MAHLFVLIEGRETWNKIFLSDLEKRRYQYKQNDGNVGQIQPNLREIKLLDISLPEQCIPALLNDLSPFAKDTSKLRGHANLLAKSLQAGIGMHSIYEFPDKFTLKERIKNFLLELIGKKKKVPPNKYERSWKVRNRWVNNIPIGWMEDNRDPLTMDKDNPNTYVPNLPWGGELI